MPFSPLRPDPDPDPAIVHVYGSVPPEAVRLAFNVGVDFGSWPYIPGTVVFGWGSDEPEYAGLVALDILPGNNGEVSSTRPLLAILVRETALFTPALRQQILLLLP
jgi:hypothetical protein